MNIGVFGGTFDPPHTGHLIVAQDAALALGLDRILFVPAARPPHKRDADVTVPAVRSEMLHRAIADDARFGMDTLELDRPGASYTVDTLRELAARDPLVRWTLLIGADQYEEFATWREPDEIRRLAQLAVLTRRGTHGAATGMPGAGAPDPLKGGSAVPAAHRIGNGDVVLQVTRIDISATEVRRRVAAGLPIRYLVPQAVEEFIFERKLYLRNGTPVAG